MRNAITTLEGRRRAQDTFKAARGKNIECEHKSESIVVDKCQSTVDDDIEVYLVLPNTE
jgi:hypothetical protein